MRVSDSGGGCALRVLLECARCDVYKHRAAIYSLSTLRSHFRRMRVMCVVCRLQGMRINESYCGEAEQNGPLVGTVAVEAAPIATYAATQLTAVAASDANGHLVIVLGTADGHLKKVLSSIAIRGRPFNGDVNTYM
jgi:hypothetical protein